MIKAQWTAVDRLDVLVLVDNVTDSLSTNPAHVEPEWSVLFGDGRLRLLAGKNICCAHHGLALLLTAHVGGATRTLLFDAGPAAATFTRNAQILGVDFAAIEAVVLSHGHWDHAGGLVAAIEAIAAKRGKGNVECYMHPGMYRQRATRRPDGELYVNEIVPGPRELEAAGAHVVNTREPQVLCGGAFHVSGEIPRVTSYEVGVPNHLTRSADGQAWEPDPLIMDERATFPQVPLHGAMGGLHLSGINEAVIPQTIADLEGFALGMLAPGHCTGWRALAAMAAKFGAELVPSAVGKRYRIEAA
jgi:7,8-dihydropterin-6-yl-methyl-4-(beta-D-ribofuranosyl)aminobenzene 5'-phosphate synthase